MAAFTPGQEVIVDGTLGRIDGWPDNDDGFFTWTMLVGYGAGAGYATCTSHTVTSTVEAVGEPPAPDIEPAVVPTGDVIPPVVSA